MSQGPAGIITRNKKQLTKEMRSFIQQKDYGVCVLPADIEIYSTHGSVEGAESQMKLYEASSVTPRKLNLSSAAWDATEGSPAQPDPGGRQL